MPTGRLYFFPYMWWRCVKLFFNDFYDFASSPFFHFSSSSRPIFSWFFLLIFVCWLDVKDDWRERRLWVWREGASKQEDAEFGCHAMKDVYILYVYKRRMRKWIKEEGSRSQCQGEQGGILLSFFMIFHPLFDAISIYLQFPRLTFHHSYFLLAILYEEQAALGNKSIWCIFLFIFIFFYFNFNFISISFSWMSIWIILIYPGFWHQPAKQYKYSQSVSESLAHSPRL